MAPGSPSWRPIRMRKARSPPISSPSSGTRPGRRSAAVQSVPCGQLVRAHNERMCHPVIRRPGSARRTVAGKRTRSRSRVSTPRTPRRFACSTNRVPIGERIFEVAEGGLRDREPMILLFGSPTAKRTPSARQSTTIVLTAERGNCGPDAGQKRKFWTKYVPFWVNLIGTENRLPLRRRHSNISLPVAAP